MKAPEKTLLRTILLIAGCCFLWGNSHAETGAQDDRQDEYLKYLFINHLTLCDDVYKKSDPEIRQTITSNMVMHAFILWYKMEINKSSSPPSRIFFQHYLPQYITADDARLNDPIHIRAWLKSESSVPWRANPNNYIACGIRYGDLETNGGYDAVVNKFREYVRVNMHKCEPNKAVPVAVLKVEDRQKHEREIMKAIPRLESEANFRKY